MVNYSLLSFVLSGERRKTILLCLDKPKIPKEMAKENNISIHNISKTLRELVDRGLIKCINPKDKFYRFYQLTKKGKEILTFLKKTYPNNISKLR